MNRKWLLIVFFLVVCFALGVFYFRFASDSQPVQAPLPDETTQLIDHYFSDFKKSKKALPEKRDLVSLIAVGDLMLSREVARKIKTRQDIHYPFLKTRDYLKNADLVFGNLECPITKGRLIVSGEMIFRADPGIEKALQEAGFSVLSLANNHTFNFGYQGLRDTFYYLDQVGIGYVGAGNSGPGAYKPIFIEKKGTRFAFLAYSDSTFVPQLFQDQENQPSIAVMDIEHMMAVVKQVRRQADLIIVSIHSGTEYAVGSNQTQISFAHAAIDAGADLVIGHHPHVIQEVERYKGKYIFYSLGNFVFDQMWSYETRLGLTAKIFFDKTRVVRIEVLPVLIGDFSQPKFLDGEPAEKALERLEIDLRRKVIFAWNQKKQIFDYKVGGGIFHEDELSAYKIKKLERADLDSDFIEEEYSLENGRLKVSQGSEEIWQSPSDWWIDDFFLADSTNDGAMNINLSVWKVASFGRSKPFWIEGDDLSVKNHFFVFSLAEDEIEPVWQSSNLAVPNCEFLFEDVDGDSKNELVVIEGDYVGEEFCQGKYVVVWRWNDWGFFDVWRSQKGRFVNLSAQEINGEKVIFVDSLSSLLPWRKGVDEDTK